MEVRPGYEQTEVGVIPEDWDVKPLSAISCEVIDCHHSTPVWTSDGVVVIRTQNIRAGKLVLTEASYTDEKHYRERIRRAKPSFGDLVITREAPMGQVCMIPSGLTCCLGQRMVLLRIASKSADPSYVLYAIQAESLQRYIAVAGGTGSTVGNLRIPVIKSLPVPIPRAPEQHAIASALSDVDALLGGLDRLIAKKRDLKQAAMQRLLTGQTRLPGFHGEWEVKRLGEALTICHGKSQREVAVADGPYPILASGGQIGTASRPLYDKPSVLIGRKGTINQPQYRQSAFWTVDTLFYSAMKYGNDAKFFYYRFCLIDWMQFNEGSGVPSLNARTIEQIEIACPEPAEQFAIAAVLSDMDAELTALEARRDKTRDLKQAMMQELLTGKTRLLHTEAANV